MRRLPASPNTATGRRRPSASWQRTEDNLLRIGDKVSELELQLEPLKVQSEKAQRYLEMKEELKGRRGSRMAGHPG